MLPAAWKTPAGRTPKIASVSRLLPDPDSPTSATRSPGCRARLKGASRRTPSLRWSSKYLI